MRTSHERILAKIDFTAETPCWRWTGHLTGGYGRIMILGVRTTAHRAAYEVFVGPVPEGLVVDHLCRNTACVNPEHLEPVTVAENTRRGDGPTRSRAAAARRMRDHFISRNPWAAA